MLTMQCNNNCVVCPVVMRSIPNGVIPCSADSQKGFIESLKDHAVIFTNARAFYYKPLAEKLAHKKAKAIVLYFGNDACEHDRNTRVKGSFEEAKIGEANLRKAGVPVVARTIFSPSMHKTTYIHPEEVVIELTSQCNLDCQYCFGRTGKDAMSTSYVKEIIDSMAKARVSRVRFSGGEPLLRQDLLELIDYSRKKGLTVWLNTNASLATEDFVRNIEGMVENVLLPFNSWDAHSEEQWTGKGNFEDKIRGAQLLKNSMIPVIRAGTVATWENIENLEKIFDQVRFLDRWEVWKPVSNNDEHFNLKKLLPKLISLSLEWGKLIPIANHVPFCDYDVEVMNVMCLGGCFDHGHSRIVVDSEGFAKPSYLDRTNIGDPRDIMGCWNHGYMKMIRNFENVQKKCRKCVYLEKCKGKS